MNTIHKGQGQRQKYLAESGNNKIFRSQKTVDCFKIIVKKFFNYISSWVNSSMTLLKTTNYMVMNGYGTNGKPECFIVFHSSQHWSDPIFSLDLASVAIRKYRTC